MIRGKDKEAILLEMDASKIDYFGKALTDLDIVEVGEDYCIVHSISNKNYTVNTGIDQHGQTWFGCACKCALHRGACKHIARYLMLLSHICDNCHEKVKKTNTDFCESCLADFRAKREEEEASKVVSVDCPRCFAEIKIQGGQVIEGCDHVPQNDIPYHKPDNRKKPEKVGNVRI